MSRVMKKNSFPNIQVGFFLIEVAFSCKPLDLLMRSTDIREPLMPHGFRSFPTDFNSGGLDGGNGLCYKVRPSPSFASFLNFFDCRKGQLFVFLKIDVNSGTLFCFSLRASNCLGARSIVPFLWT
jgi:hypothetical protein